MDAHFWWKDLPNSIHRQLQDLCQQVDESLEEFAECTQELTADGYPEAPDIVVNTIAMDAFLKGCSEKWATLTVMDRNTLTLHVVLSMVKNAVHNQHVLLGSKKSEVRHVHFFDDDD